MNFIKELVLISLVVALWMVACANAGVLPDPKLTPGATNPDVTQATINQTICVSGWTKTIRPPASYTTKLKISQLVLWGIDDKNPADYEEDHLISLQLGGSPTSEKNLWPESYAGKCGARKKDVIETRLKTLICKGKVTLSDAQKAITTNWVEAYSKYVGPLECGGGI